MGTKIKIPTNLDRLSEMTMVQFDTPLEKCTIKQMKDAIDCIIAEDLYFEHEDQCALDSENAYYGLLDF